jgi:threonine/homoserine/homoserine lactone efflux protein
MGSSAGLSLAVSKPTTAPEMSLSFALAALLLLITPGPTNTLLGAFGAAIGLRRALLLPVAEALGYAVAITAFHAAASLLAGTPHAMALVKAVAGLWLLYSAWRLWSEPVIPALPQAGAAFRRVLVTTMLNPKALFVATVIIPELWMGPFVTALALYLGLALIAGAVWTALGAAVPAGLRGYSYKAASVVIFGFALAAMGSVFAG